MGAKDYWLNERRLRIYPRFFVAAYAGVVLYWLGTQFWFVEEPATALRNDFAGFWSLGHLVLEGRASDAYDPGLAVQAEMDYVPEHKLNLYWFYPPHFFFLIGGFATLPYFPAFFLWVAATLACLTATVRALAPHPATIWLLLASPGVFWTIRWGQTGILAAALLGGALFFLARGRHLTAGVLIGLLTFKPHLGVLIPFALIASRQWRVFATATATTLAVAGASAFAFGADAWLRFFEAMEAALLLQSEGVLPHHQMVSLYAPLRVAGLSFEAALALQGLLGLGVLMAIVHVWRRHGADFLSGAVLMAGSVLLSPHLLGYDLVVLAPAITILTWDGVRRGWLPVEREGYILLWLWPWISDSVATVTNFPIGIVGSLLLFVLAVRRCRVMGQSVPLVETRQAKAPE